MTNQYRVSLADFVLARVAEDERVAESIDADPYGVFRRHGGTGLRWAALGGDRPWQTGKARILAECEAKRRIVERADVNAECREHGGALYTDCPECQAAEAVNVADGLVLRDLAAVYADHPDYRDDWKP